MILVISGAVFLMVVAGMFWLWLRVTDGEVGPALVATVASVAAFGVALFLMFQMQDRGGDEGRVWNGPPGSVVKEASIVPGTAPNIA